MLLNDFYVLMQKYSISQLRLNKDYQILCKCIGNQYDNLQKVSQYLLNSCDIDKAEGVWLDYLGWLVGTTRQYFNIARFFSVNSDDVNVEKYFWFVNQTIGQIASLSDELFRKRIYAKIGYNTTKGTRKDNNYIIKNMSNAEKVIITKIEPMVLDITIYGSEILETNTMLDDIENILGTGVGLRNLKIQNQGVNDNGKTSKAGKLVA
ncbi:DUF2612 domain-containing protein [Spirochaetes bacterium]|uniref:DUF2612 domain-containing protein n=1 Tax=Candidatus Scatousia excrementipullorum TaxID=2840936 RepID=A0A9D9DQE6_9BACT|nr:DUF2612 domain-containing protein [Candidatus Scatousia excrementipullorum]